MENLTFFKYYMLPRDKFIKMDLVDGYHNFFLHKDLQNIFCF